MSQFHRHQGRKLKAQEVKDALPVINVPCSQKEHAAAFQLGVSHGFNRSKKKPNFILQANRTAYALGFVSGTAARQVQRERSAQNG